ncbi:MAG: hypothetical protein HRT89_02580 [Lentisphaeria bacterium]|nr:hypothetical protein [Lentisphaeria bacterium]NQZ66934.1 hypothetical protein [Lentisphaeria bacterium]
MNLAIWILQFIVSYATGEFFDILDLFGIRQQKGAAYFYTGTFFGITLFRPTGLFNEPGSYAMVIIQLLILDFFMSNKKFDKIHAIALFTLFLSLSTFSILLGFLFVVAYCFTQPKKTKLYAIMLLFMGLVSCFLIYYISIRFGESANSAISGLDFRRETIQYWMDLPIGDKLFGHEFTFHTIMSNRTIYQVYIEDLSFLFYMLFYTGIIFTCLFIFFLYYTTKSPGNFLFISIILFSKAYIGTYFLWTTIVFLYIICHQKKLSVSEPADEKDSETNDQEMEKV